MSDISVAQITKSQVFNETFRPYDGSGAYYFVMVTLLTKEGDNNRVSNISSIPPEQAQDGDLRMKKGRFVFGSGRW